MPSREVLSIIASLNGGFNGDLPNKQIGVEIVSDTEAIYTLTEWVIGDGGALVEKVGVERFQVTLTEMPAELPPTEEVPAFTESQVEPIDSI